MGIQQADSSVKCCLCGEHVLKSGWCDNCRTWPINITPRRWCAQAHPVDQDGFCGQCQTYVLTRLEAENGEWTDTGKVPQLLSREENLRRLRLLDLAMRSVGSLTVDKHFRPRTHRSREEIDRQKELLLRMDGKPAAEEVPF